VGRPDLADDPGLASNAGRDLRAIELYGVIDAWVVARDGDCVLAALEAAEVPASSVYSVADMFRDAQFAARGMLEQATLPDGTPMRIPGVVPRLTETPGSTEWLGPGLGEHTDELLAGLGYKPERIAALRADGAI
jgi:formyl-CoA transferase